MKCTNDFQHHRLQITTDGDVSMNEKKHTHTENMRINPCTTAINTEHKHAKIVEHNFILVNAPTKFWLDKSFSASPKLVTVHFNFYIHSAMRSVDY